MLVVSGRRLILGTPANYGARHQVKRFSGQWTMDVSRRWAVDVSGQSWTSGEKALILYMFLDGEIALCLQAYQHAP